MKGSGLRWARLQHKLRNCRMYVRVAVCGVCMRSFSFNLTIMDVANTTTTMAVIISIGNSRSRSSQSSRCEINLFLLWLNAIKWALEFLCCHYEVIMIIIIILVK